MSAQDQDANGLEQLGRNLGFNREQREERNNPVDHQVEREKIKPWPAGALHEVWYFFRNISVPDEQILAGPDVGPEGRESEEHLAQVVDLVVADPITKRTVLPQEEGGQSYCGDALHEQAGKSIKAEHGAAPLWFQRADQIVGNQGKSERECQYKHRGQAVEPLVDRHVFAGIVI